MVVSIQNVSKSFSAGPVLKDISFQVNEGDKLAIIGNNGTGKSTLLKIIVGEEHEDSGEIVLGKNVTLGYLAQYQSDNLSGKIYDIVLSAREDLLAMEKNLRNMEMKMCDIDINEMDHFMDIYHKKSKEFEDLGGLTFRSEVNGVLKGLGFSEEDFEKDLNTLSGGQKTRVAMGRLLIQKPSVLLLDEPINHLDLNSIQWLENYLAQYEGAVIIVAHDRYFLDRVVNRVVDLSQHKAVCYKGNYSDYAKQKEERDKTLMHQYEKQEKFIEHQEAVIDKLKQFNREKSIKRAESRVKVLDKIERMDAPALDSRKMNLTLEPDIRSGNDVLQVSNISKSFDDITLFENLNFEIHRGERVAILGDNGTGEETTILKLITGRKDKDAGMITLGANVTIGYYDQEQQELDENKTLFEEMQDAYPQLNDTRIRNVLAAFLFTGDEVFQPIKTLSGGERGRVSLAKLMLSGANLLILDEPTNHLDMESKEILEQALSGYTGTLLYVSHDRYFIQKTATRILELSDHCLTEYQGDYEYYLKRKEELKEKSSLTDSGAANEEQLSDNGKTDWAVQKEEARRIQKLEREKDAIEKEIADLENEIAEIDVEYSKDEVAHNSSKLNELTAKQNELKDRLEQCYEKWEDLEMALS